MGRPSALPVLSVYRGFQSLRMQAADFPILLPLDVALVVGSRCASLRLADVATLLARRHVNGRSVDWLAAASSSMLNRKVSSYIVPTTLLHILPVQLLFGTVLGIMRLVRVSVTSHIWVQARH